MLNTNKAENKSEHHFRNDAGNFAGHCDECGNLAHQHQTDPGKAPSADDNLTDAQYDARRREQWQGNYDGRYDDRISEREQIARNIGAYHCPEEYMGVKVKKSFHPSGQTAHTLANGRTIYLPNGLRVVPASNLPAEAEIKYWLDELPKGYECDTEIESHFRNYGFGLRADEVR